MISQRKAGILLSYLSEMIKILTGFIYTPVMLRLLGQSEYGLYQLVHSAVSCLGLLSMGFGASYMRFYSRYKTENNQDGVGRLNGMFILIFGVISVICMICGVVMYENIEGVFGIGLTKTEYATARILLIFMIISLALTFIDSVFNCIITANEKFIFQKLLIVLQSILSPFLTLPLLIMGYGSVGMVVVTTLLTLAVLTFDIYFCLKKLHISIIFRGMQFSLLKEVWIFTFFIFLDQLINQVNWSIDRFLLGRLSGTIAVAVYGVGGQMNTMYIQLSTSVSNVFIPEVNRIVAETDDNIELTGLLIKVGRVQFMILALVLGGFIFFGRSFVRFWAGEGYENAYYVTLFLIAPVTVPLIQNIGIEIQKAKNKHKMRSVVFSFIALANVCISIPLIRHFGPAGAAGGTALALTVGNIFFMNWYYHNCIGIDIGRFWRSIAKLMPALVIPCIVGMMISCFAPVSHLVEMSFWIIIYTVIYCGSVYFLGMNPEEKNMVSGLTKRILGKK